MSNPQENKILNDIQNEIMQFKIDINLLQDNLKQSKTQNEIEQFTRRAELGWVCTLMSPQFDFWYCKYDNGGSFIKKWHVGIHGRLDGILD